jgi:hypothetical protein
MKPTSEPNDETVAATDAVFKEGSPTAAEKKVPQLPPTTAEPDVRPDEAASPLQDYVRDLGQEFQEEEDEGKL